MRCSLHLSSFINVLKKVLFQTKTNKELEKFNFLIIKRIIQ